MSVQAEKFIDRDIKRAWANILARLRRRLRGLIRLQKDLSSKRKDLKEVLAAESAKTFKNQFRIAELQNVFTDMDGACSDIEKQLFALGHLLFESLPAYEDSGASDHDFAQLINCNIKKMEQLRADFDERGRQDYSFFVDAVFICHAEQPIEREKESFVIFPDLPFFHAMTHYFMESMESNPKMKKAAHDALDKFFPELRANQYIATEGENGELTLKKYYPPLKLV